MDEEQTQKSGIAFIVDLGGFPSKLFKFLSPKATIISALKEEVTTDNYPSRDSLTHTHTHTHIYSSSHQPTGPG